MALDDTAVVVGSPAPAAGSSPAAGNGLGAISVVGARKFFGVTRALDGCNFSARLGEIHAIVGGNGCGKSTLAKVISGVLPLDGGQVQVLGRTATTPHEARDIGIATVFQEVLVADECSIVDNVFMGTDTLFSATLSTREKVRAAAALMRDLTGERIDVGDVVGTLPLGTKQWITIARALLTSPKVLILDESSAALDFDSTERLFARMRQLRDQGSAVLIVTHRIAELIRISDRATVMRDGRDVGVLERQEVTERNLLSLMTGQAATAKEARATDQAVLDAPAVMRGEGLRLWEGAEPVDFSLHRGEILGVAGLDGQGQNEFVRALAGVKPALSGAPVAVRGDGGETAITTLEEAVGSGIVYVSGDRKKEGIFANLSIFENMLMPLYRSKSRGGKLALIDWKGLEGIFSWEVDKLAIKMGDRGDKITSLSGGNQQKVLIARGFAMKPDIIVLNDPARGIDVGAKSELYRHLRDFAASGKSVVYMSSELEEFIGFATRVIVFRHGSVFDEFVGGGIEPARILEAMFGQTAGLKKSPARDGRKAPAAADEAARRAKAWAPAKEGVDNPLKAPSPRLESPVKSTRAKAPETVAKPAAPHVAEIKVVAFDGEPAATDVSPFRRREGGR
jgi:ribose transport system ATP-binding protein